MEIVEDAIIFAAKAHYGSVRKMAGLPYIVHPMEVAGIIASITDDKEVIAAGILHDTIEDANVTFSELEDKFGYRIANLVNAETEQKMRSLNPAETWLLRKQSSLKMLKESEDSGVSIMWLADKLSNIRSIRQNYDAEGDAVWNYFHQKDKKMHEWYYRTVAEYLKGVQNTRAYKEYIEHVNYIFGEKETANG